MEKYPRQGLGGSQLRSFWPQGVGDATSWCRYVHQPGRSPDTILLDFYGGLLS